MKKLKATTFSMSLLLTTLISNPLKAQTTIVIQPDGAAMQVYYNASLHPYRKIQFTGTINPPQLMQMGWYCLRVILLTRIILQMLCYLYRIQDMIANPSQVLVLCFSNKSNPVMLRV